MNPIRLPRIVTHWLLTRLIFLFFCFGMFRPVLAGDIFGRVRVARTAKVDTRIISRAIIRRYVNKHAAEKSNAGFDEHPEIVVYLTGGISANSPSRREVVVLDQKRERFVPHVLPIVVGTTVDFLNSDDVYHNVFSFSTPRSFDLGRYKKGKKRSVTFDKTGVVKVYCDIHTHMNAFVLVLENPYFATTDQNGDYRIHNVPPGEYTINVWQGRWPEKSRSVIVAPEGNTVVDFRFE